MKLSTFFVSSALLFSVAIARPSRLAERVAARESRRSRPFTASTNAAIASSNATHAEFSTNWSGVVIETPPSGQTFSKVTGTFVVPTPSGNSGAASAWVGIDGDTASQSILQSGVDFTISGGRVTYDAWFEWFPNFATDFSNFAISSGNTITVTVQSTSSTRGTVTLTNESTGKTVTQALSAPDSAAALRGQNAEWIVEDFEEGNSLVPFANFGTVEFTGASASTSSETLTPASGVILDIEQNGEVLTSVTSSGSTVTVKHT
ncbi:glutamic protease [Lentinula edodes]|uniref:Peptidase A4 family-domain-containing protein n=1 Tax=Lentinula lateritia TaxID=40482 RepID=A0A9W9AL72_9AGAR|nr:glutamic protease [Lentinula edodes]KAJ3891968.1 glutamic protease [Lentinula edodes]KAJ4483090.1 peptidase A4 family-domain-containing protein [Lentinula edodes]